MHSSTPPPGPTHSHQFRYLRDMTVAGKAYDVFFCQICLEYRVVDQNLAFNMVPRSGGNGSWGN